MKDIAHASTVSEEVHNDHDQQDAEHHDHAADAPAPEAPAPNSIQS